MRAWNSIQCVLPNQTIDVYGYAMIVRDRKSLLDEGIASVQAMCPSKCQLARSSQPPL